MHLSWPRRSSDWGTLIFPVDQNPYRAKFGRYVLYPAVNWPHKNHYRLVEAFRFLTQVYGLNDVKLILTGAACVEPRAHFYKTLLDQPWAKIASLNLDLYPICSSFS